MGVCVCDKIILEWKYTYIDVLTSVPTPFPEWNSLPFPYFFMTWWPIFPINFTWNCVKPFYLQRIFQDIGYERTWSFNNLVLSVVKYPPPFFLIELYFPPLRKHAILYIFLTFWPISQTFLTLSASSLPFQCLKRFKCDFWLFQDFSYPWELFNWKYNFTTIYETILFNWIQSEEWGATPMFSFFMLAYLLVWRTWSVSLVISVIQARTPAYEQL